VKSLFISHSFDDLFDDALVDYLIDNDLELEPDEIVEALMDNRTNEDHPLTYFVSYVNILLEEFIKAKGHGGFEQIYEQLGI
jgi:hypothetical protein